MSKKPTYEALEKRIRELEQAESGRKQAEEALSESEEKFRRIVETAGEGFILMDEDLKIIEANNAYCKMLGFLREDLIGKTPFDLATDEFRQFMSVNREEILATEYRDHARILRRHRREIDRTVIEQVVPLELFRLVPVVYDRPREGVGIDVEHRTFELRRAPLDADVLGAAPWRV